MAESRGVYDSEERKDKSALAQDAKKYTPASKKSLRSAEQTPDTSTGATGQDAPTTETASSLSPEALRKQEVANFIKQDATSNSGRRSLRYIKQHRRKLLGGGGIAALIATGVVTLFLMLIPLKIEHMVTNLQKHFFATSEQAVENQSDKLLQRYIVKHVLPSYKSCGSTVNRHCRVTVSGVGSNPVKNLYNGWANARLENTLAEKYNIEFKYDRSSNSWLIKAPGTGADGDNIGRDGSGLGREFSAADRQGVRTAVRDAFQNETRWKQTMYRFKVGALLEEKYGIKRCVIFCGVTDPLHNKVDAQKRAAKIYVVDRVLQSRSNMTLISLRCLLDDGCHPENTTPNHSNDPAAGETGGAPISDAEAEGRTSLSQLGSRFGTENLDQLDNTYKEMSEKGFQKYLIEKIFAQVLSADAAKLASQKVSDALPVVGWIDFIARAVNAANDSGPKLKKLAYMTNAAAAVSAYMTYRTYADEVHTGHVNATELGSWVSSLGPVSEADQNDTLVGGTASAEQSPLYSEIVDGSSNNSSSAFIDNLIPGKAYAAESQNNSAYKCNNGDPVPAGALVCKEEILGLGNGTANAVHEFMNIPGMAIITGAAQVWRATLGKIFDVANGAIGLAAKPFQAALDAAGCNRSIGPITVSPANALVGNLPYCQAKDFVEKEAGAVMKKMADWLLPNPFGVNMSGGRTFDMLAAGASVSGHDSCDQIGCKDVPTQVAANIIDEQMAEDRADFQSKPIFARMFDASNDNSLVTRVAMSIPANARTSATNSVATLMRNPIGSLPHYLGSLLSQPRVFAASDKAADPFGVGTVAFPKDEIPEDPEQYWDDHCSDNASQAYQNDAEAASHNWNQDAADHPDPNTGMPTHTFTNACALIKHTVGNVGAKYDTDLLTSDEQKTLQTQTVSPGSTNGTTGSLPKGNAKDLATELKKYVDNGKVKCLSSGCPDIAHTASGQSIKGGEGCLVDALRPELVGMLLQLAQMGHSFVLSALCSDHHNDGIKEHSGGAAADFNTIDGVFMGPDNVAWDTQKVTVGKKLDADVASFMPKQTEFLQQQCHPKFDFLNGFGGSKILSDPCHHQHISVGNL